MGLTPFVPPIVSSPLLILGQYIDRDLIEACDAICLRPQCDLSCSGEGLVRRREKRFAAKLDGELVAPGLDAERVPLIARNFGIRAANLLTTALNDTVKTHIVLKRIGADDIVVVGIEDTDGNSTCLIDAPCDRFEPHGYVNVSGDNWFKNSKWKTIVRWVRAGLLDHPARN